MAQKFWGVAKIFLEGGQNLTCVIMKHVDLVCVIFAMNTFGIHLTRVNTFRIHPVSVINSCGVNPVSVLTDTDPEQIQMSCNFTIITSRTFFLGPFRGYFKWLTFLCKSN